MTFDFGRAVRWTAVAAGLAMATAAGAAGKLSRLPGEYIFAQGDGSPGPVTFSHDNHVDAKSPSCVTCHPAGFRILERGKTSDGERIVHARMEKGAACGSCHDGTKAFGFDSCENCHK